MGTYLTNQTPQTNSNFTSTTTDTPAWMQQAIYNQIQNAVAAEQMPYQAYNLPSVAKLSPLQQQAYSQIQQNSNNFYAPTGMNANLGGAANKMLGYQTSDTATGLGNAQANYLSKNTPAAWIKDANTNWQGATDLSPTTAANSQLANAATSAGNITASSNPYLTTAGATSYSNVDKYMNPYQTGVLDAVAKQGARNLNEILLPQISDQFIKAGQFGGNRMGEFASRALRDTQESILNKQAELANQGYTQALGASQADLARQATLAQTAGNLASQQSQAYQNVGQTQGQLSTQEQQNLATIANQQAQQAAQQQQLGLTAAKDVQAAQAADATRQMGALNDYTTMLANQQKMQGVDAAALEAAGQAQQAQEQAQLTQARQDWQTQQDYAKNQLDWMNAQIRGLPANTIPSITSTLQQGTGNSYAPSALQQLASGLSLYKGLTSP